MSLRTKIFAIALFALLPLSLLFALSGITTTGQRRYGTIAGTGSSDYVIAIGGRYPSPTTLAFNRPLFSLSANSTDYFARFEFSASVNDANISVPYRVWLVKKGNSSTTDYEFQLLGTGTATSAALQHAGTEGGTVFPSGEYLCDTITFTPATTSTSPIGIYTALSAAYFTTNTVYSPGSLIPARVFISDAGNFGYLVFDADPADGKNITFSVEAGT